MNRAGYFRSTPNHRIVLCAAFIMGILALDLAADPGGLRESRPAGAPLTAADVLGPDGLVYPDFTWAGVPGGIPPMPVAIKLVDLGGRPGDDISDLLEQAVARVSQGGGGAILIGEGTFYLDQPVLVFSSNIVIRGAGPDKTRMVFRYRVPKGGIRFFRLVPGQQIGPGGTIEFHAHPKNLVVLELRSGEKVLERRVRRDHWGNTFSIRASGGRALRELGEGPHTFTALAEYQDGTRITETIGLDLVRKPAGEPAPNQLAAVSFVGRGFVGNPVLLAGDAHRGSCRLELARNHGLVGGDRINLVAPASERWRALVGHASPWEIQAQNFYEVTAVDGGTVTIRQPLRVDYLLVDAPFVRKIEVLSNCGVEDLSLEQEVVPNQDPPGPKIDETLWHAIEDLWTSGITTHFAWGCWIRNVTVRKTGRNAVYFPMSKQIEVRHCLFDDALFKGGGGTAYIGFDRTWDSLIDSVETRGMRHAPNNQWNASGNVVRNSRFIGSDGQWHAGWTHENLYENNFIDARGGGGSYGHGLYASGPSSGVHGPQGPRNVVYHNDVIARRDSFHMLGGNEGWMILFNRFLAEEGRSVFVKEKGGHHLIAHNTFIQRKPVAPPVFLGADCVGVQLLNNSFYGIEPPLVGYATGHAAQAVDKGNVSEPAVPRPLPAHPQPKVASIFQWQLDNLPAIQARRTQLERVHPGNPASGRVENGKRSDLRPNTDSLLVDGIVPKDHPLPSL
jgi:hypothetical protein